MRPSRDAPETTTRRTYRARRSAAAHRAASTGRRRRVPAPPTRATRRGPLLPPAPRPRRVPSPRRRLIGLLLALGLAFVAVSARLVELQALGRDRYQRLGLDQRVRTVKLAAERGSIFDRNGHDLAVSARQHSVYANPRVVQDPGGYAAQLAQIVGVDQTELAQRLAQRDKAFVYIARKVGDDVVARVKALHLPGVGFVPESKRFYPAGPVAGPLVGFVGTDNGGLGGLEAQYNTLLTGKPGEVVTELDPQGRRLPDATKRVVPSQRGGDVVVTIDQSLQYETESVLADEVTKAQAKGGTAVVMDVRTGDVLTLATVEGATQGHPARPAPSDARNRPLTDVYEPGSTNKVITVTGAIESGLVSAETALPTPGELTIDGTVYKDVDTHPGVMTVADIVRESSNIGTIQIAKALGRERFDAYLRAFGFGAPTGLGFPGESSGLLLPLAEYNDTSMASIPIGNGLAVTAMQMIDVYATLANHGVSTPPRLVAATVGTDGTRHDAPAPATRRVVSSATADAMTAMLEAVVQGGTGTKAAVPGYRVAGKTGTARKPPYDKPPYRYVASFAGYAPADAPRLAAIVVLDEPRGGYFGGQVAAPVFSRIMAFALRFERVAPSPSGAPGAPPGVPSGQAYTLTPTP